MGPTMWPRRNAGCLALLRSSEMFRGVAACVVVAGCLVGCRVASPPQSVTPRYQVTASPIDVGNGIRLCVAIDPADSQGVWWWGPGASGCASRSTGPGVFRADQATVSQSPPTAVGFRLGTHSATRPFIDVRMVI